MGVSTPALFKGQLYMQKMCVPMSEFECAVLWWVYMSEP